MKVNGTGRLTALLVAVLVSGPVLARDVYKASLDPAIPRHQAVLDTLSRLEANPKDSSAKNDLGCLIAQEGFWRDALREFDEAADLDPKDGRPYFNAGLVKATKGEWRGARSYFQKATKRDPGNWSAWWMIGFAEEQLGNTSAAVSNYKHSLRVNTSLFDVAVNPYAAWTQLRGRVLLESYEARRVKATLPRAEQLEEPERIAAFFQKAKKGDEHGRPAPAPTPEAATGPVVSAAPASSPSQAPAASSGPTWNPTGPMSRRREENPQPPPRAVQEPPSPRGQEFEPATLGAPGGKTGLVPVGGQPAHDGGGAPGGPGGGPGAGPGIGGGTVPPVPSPAPK